MSENKSRILVVDDDEDIRAPLVRYFRENGYKVDAAHDAAGARTLLKQHFIHLILLDIMLPEQSGTDFCREIRQESNIPVIFLTARTTEIDRVLGFELGADDYVTKPFQPRELLARVEAVIRRSGSPAYSSPNDMSRIFHFGDWVYFQARAEIRNKRGVILSLSSTENKILSIFMKFPKKELPRQLLLHKLHGEDSEKVFDRSIDTQISRLRKKLGTLDRGGQYINTVWGAGYMFSADIECEKAQNG